MNITEEELCFEAECIATLRGADLLAKAFRRNSRFLIFLTLLCVSRGYSNPYYSNCQALLINNWQYFPKLGVFFGFRFQTILKFEIRL